MDSRCCFLLFYIFGGREIKKWLVSPHLREIIEFDFMHIYVTASQPTPPPSKDLYPPALIGGGGFGWPGIQAAFGCLGSASTEAQRLLLLRRTLGGRAVGRRGTLAMGLGRVSGHSIGNWDCNRKMVHGLGWGSTQWLGWLRLGFSGSCWFFRQKTLKKVWRWNVDLSLNVGGVSLGSQHVSQLLNKKTCESTPLFPYTGSSPILFQALILLGMLQTSFKSCVFVLCSTSLCTHHL